jgi:hypothetical protein
MMLAGLASGGATAGKKNLSVAFACDYFFRFKEFYGQKWDVLDFFHSGFALAQKFAKFLIRCIVPVLISKRLQGKEFKSGRVGIIKNCLEVHKTVNLGQR